MNGHGTEAKGKDNAILIQCINILLPTNYTVSVRIRVAPYPTLQYYIVVAKSKSKPLRSVNEQTNEQTNDFESLFFYVSELQFALPFFF